MHQCLFFLITRVQRRACKQYANTSPQHSLPLCTPGRRSGVRLVTSAMHQQQDHCSTDW
jgi:hypothetical protein